MIEHVLRDYALLADGERGALIGPRGDIAWMCAPRWDSGSVFSALIGGEGVYSVTPVERYVWGGRYEGTSMIWRSRWVTGSGVIECREALAFPAETDRLVLLRQLRAVDAPARATVTLHPRADYDRRPMTRLHPGGGSWHFRVGDLHGRWSAGPGARRTADGAALTLDVRLAAGEQRDLVLELATSELADDRPDPHDLWRRTEAAWDAAVPSLTNTLAPRDTGRSLAVLRGLTSSGGGMVAAATTSLPERSEADRNYDYRYVWIRDQCYAGRAAATVGATELLDAAVGFVTARLLEHGADMVPAYTVTGAAVPPERGLDLPGYPGGSDKVGNRARNQFQLDGFGEALLLLASAAQHDRLDRDGWQAVDVAAAVLAERWTEPDSGIWEIDERMWTHSRLIGAAGLRAVAAHRPGRSSREWLALADRIVAETSAQALHSDGRWQRAPDDPAHDAALLLAGLRGAVPADDPRTVATLDSYLRDLTVDGYAYRYRHDDRPLPDAEGAFLLCGFWVALALHQQGRAVEARAWFERTRAACGPPALFTEEFDGSQHQLRGNLPQAFVHALMVETSARLAGKE